jgi:hypothetical protein
MIVKLAVGVAHGATHVNDKTPHSKLS